MAFGATQAHAVSFGADFNNAFLKTGAFPNPGLDINNAPPAGSDDPIIVQGDVIPTPPSSAFTVPDGCTPGAGDPPDGFCFPTFEGLVLSGAIGVAVDLVATEDVTGTINSTTGELSTTASEYNASLLLDFTPGPNGPDGSGDEDTCVIGDIPGGAVTPALELAFNTTQPFPSPYAGDPFTVTIPPFTDVVDNGAMVATWPTLPAAIHTAGPDDPGNDCATVDTLTPGRGGLWIAAGLAAPTLNSAPVTPTTPAAPAAKKKKKCKKKKKKGKSASAAAKCKKKKKK